MSQKFSSYMSLIISIFSALICIVCLARLYPTQGHLGFDYIGVIVAIFGILVTALIGWQIIQIIFAENKMEKIASEAADKIAKSTSEEIARAVSQEVASKVSQEVANNSTSNTVKTIMETMTSDISLLAGGIASIQDAKIEAQSGNYLEAINDVFNVIEKYKKAQDPLLINHSHNDALELLKDIFEITKDYGGLRILEGKRDKYLSLIDPSSPLASVIIKFVSDATERPLKYDEDQSEKEMHDIVFGAIDEAEKKSLSNNSPS